LPCLRPAVPPVPRRVAAAWDLAQMEAICPCPNSLCLALRCSMRLHLAHLRHKVVRCHNKI
jgi:hypothetical protein